MEDTKEILEENINIEFDSELFENIFKKAEEVREEEKVEEVIETPKRKKKEVLNKIVCKVNYNLPNKNKTSILYSNEGSSYSVFIDGIYNGTVEIEYSGEKFLSKNIKSVNNI